MTHNHADDAGPLANIISMLGGLFLHFGAQLYPSNSAFVPALGPDLAQGPASKKVRARDGFCGNPKKSLNNPSVTGGAEPSRVHVDLGIWGGSLWRNEGRRRTCCLCKAMGATRVQFTGF